jgi:anaerobic magnesium-protoporphyrin IX monomethyl ester cyclase
MRGCRVALVNPAFKGSFDGFPMGILYLAAALEETDHEVRVLDYSGSTKDAAGISTEILDWHPDIVGITGTSPSHFEAMRLASEIRARCREVWLVKGGYHEKYGTTGDALLHETTDGHYTLNYVVSSNAGEAHIVEIANARSEGRKPKDMKGLLRFGPTHQLSRIDYDAVTPTAPRLIPARHLLEVKKPYEYQGVFGDLRATQILTYRGCRFRCTFCAIGGEEGVADLEIVERDLKTLRAQGYEAVFVDDGSFTADWKRAERICDLLKEYDLEWACQTRIDLVNESRLKYMASRGCKYVYFGLESGSRRVLKSIKKNLHVEHVGENIRITQAQGMKAVTSFVFGVPVDGYDHPDDRDDWEASVRLIQQAKPDTVVPTIFAYYPGSPAWNDLPFEKRGLYAAGVSRENIWAWFDDGYGAIHCISTDVAEEIKEFLQGEIGDFLWRGLDHPELIELRPEVSVLSKPSSNLELLDTIPNLGPLTDFAQAVPGNK